MFNFTLEKYPDNENVRDLYCNGEYTKLFLFFGGKYYEIYDDSEGEEKVILHPVKYTDKTLALYDLISYYFNKVL